MQPMQKQCSPQFGDGGRRFQTARRAFWSIAGAACVLSASTARAAEPSAQELAVARELFEKAQASETEEDWGMCEEHVSEAVSIIETPGLRFHLAYCKERQGRWVEALVDYKRAQELLSSGVDAKDVEELLGPAIERLELEIPKLTLLMDEVPDGTELFLDGAERSTRLLGRAIPVDPGGRRITVSAPGYQPFAKHINLLSKDRRTVRIRLVQKDDAQPAGASDDSNGRPEPANDQRLMSSSGVSAKTWVLIGEAALTLGGLGFGVYYTTEGSRLERERDSILEAIDTNMGSCAPNAVNRHPACGDLADTNDDITLAGGLSIAGYVTAGVGISALVATWVLWDDSAAANPAAGGPLGAIMLPGGGYATYRGQF